VRLIGHHAGISLGFYGTSHHATEDLAIMRSIANLAVVAPADAPMLSAALAATVEHPGPLYLRIGRGREPDVYAPGTPFELGRAIVHDVGADITIVATGSMVSPSLEAVRLLRAQGHDAGVVDVHTLKPLDADAIVGAARSTRILMTVEEHSIVGGLGGAVAETLMEAGVAVGFHRHGLRDEYSLIGAPHPLYHHYRLDAEGIAAEALELLGGT
jgi:transketolase